MLKPKIRQALRKSHTGGQQTIHGKKLFSSKHKKSAQFSRADEASTIENDQRRVGPLSDPRHRNVSLTAEWEILAPSFGLITRLGHINLWNTSPFGKYVLSFRCITLRSHQLIIKPWRDRPCSRQRKCDCDFCLLILEFLRNLRGRGESSLCLFTILRLLKRLFRTLSLDFRSDVSDARINRSTRKEARESSYQCEPIHLRRNFKLELLEHVILDLRNLPAPKQALASHLPTFKMIRHFSTETV
jgi:hypothetical protein